MGKISHILVVAVALLGFCSCEEEFEVDLSNKEPKMYVECFPGSGDTTWLHLGKAVAVGAKEDLGSNFYIKSMSFTRNGSLMDLHMAEDKTCWYTTAKMNPGENLEFSLETNETEKVTASTKVPRLPDFTFQRDTLNENAYLQYTLTFDESVDADAKLAFAVIEKEVYQSEDEDGNPVEYVWESSCSLTTIENESNIFSSLQDAFKMTTIPYGTGKVDAAFINGGELLSGNRISFAAYFTEGAEYRLLVFALSDEAYGYMKAKYQQENNALAMLGLAPANFAYSNVSGGYGVLGAITAREAE